jgi:DNA (cytosine-5)-methyltransferase 1
MWRTLDLFCGCGGMSLGFQNAGFEIVAAFDNAKPALDTYTRNFSHPAFLCDLATLEDMNPLAEFRADVVIGGPPCQDFSSAGKRDQSLGRADLTLQFANIITALMPRFFVMENVELIAKAEVFREAKILLGQKGYALNQVVLDASLCGVPQSRKRLFLVGQLGGIAHALEPVLQAGLNNIPMTLHDYFGDSLGLEFYYRHPRSYARRAIFGIHEPSPTIRGVNRPIPATYQLHSGDPVRSLEGIRPLTTWERARVQTFPKNFEFIGTKASLEQQIGNAVPVKLAEHVAQCLKNYTTQPVQDSLFAAIP